MENVVELKSKKEQRYTGPINVMVDLETLGTSSNSVILSIGAVVFFPDELCLDLSVEQRQVSEQTFYVEIDPNQGRQIDISTLKWWFTQETKCPINGQVQLGQALQDFVNWLAMVSEGDFDRLIMWANGTDFDISLLGSAFAQFGAKPVWKYSNVRDYRTVVKMFGSEVEKPDGAVAHNALADAQWQVSYLQLIYKHLQNGHHVFIK